MNARPESNLTQGVTVRVVISRDEAEDVCWAYCGHKPAQRSALFHHAMNAFQLAARVGGTERQPHSKEIAVDLPRDEAEAMGFNGDPALIDRVLERINEAL